MADGQLSLCPLLCFLKSKYSRISSNLLKLVLKDFYSYAEFSYAYEKLHSDLVSLNLVSEVPAFKRRREGQLQAVIDDLLNLIVFADENNLFNSLPMYVSDSAEKMPALRLFDGDLKFLLLNMEKYEKRCSDMFDRMAAMTGKFAAMSSRLDAMSSKLDSLTGSRAVSQSVQSSQSQAVPLSQLSWPSLKRPPVTVPGVGPIDAIVTSQASAVALKSSSVNPPTVNAQTESTAIVSASATATATEIAGITTLTDIETISVPSRTWANVCSTEVLYSSQLEGATLGNFEPLDSADSEDQHDFIRVERKRRRRNTSQLHSASTPAPGRDGARDGAHGSGRGMAFRPGSSRGGADFVSQEYSGFGTSQSNTRPTGDIPSRGFVPRSTSQGNRRGRGRSVLSGCASSRVGQDGHRISAVQPVVSKNKNYCIDNVSPSVSIDAMYDFLVDDLRINVISLFEAQSRRRRNDLNFSDRKAFRLRISEIDLDKLLVPEQWPSGIRISEWYYRAPRRQTETDDDIGVRAASVAYFRATATAPSDDVNGNDNGNVLGSSADLINDSTMTLKVADDVLSFQSSCRPAECPLQVNESVDAVSVSVLDPVQMSALDPVSATGAADDGDISAIMDTDATVLYPVPVPDAVERDIAHSTSTTSLIQDGLQT